jgi:5,10-methylenetetrahydromethanopterin reductase
MLSEQPAPQLLDAIATADTLGYYGCYSADEIYHKDAWLMFAAAAHRTERIRLSPWVAPIYIYMREPTYIAQLAATWTSSVPAAPWSCSGSATSR